MEQKQPLYTIKIYAINGEKSEDGKRTIHVGMPIEVFYKNDLLVCRKIELSAGVDDIPNMTLDLVPMVGEKL